MKKGKTPKSKLVLRIILDVFILLVLMIGLYISNYYHAGESATELLDDDHCELSVTNDTSEQILFAPEHPKAGLIFYPGGKVQYESYTPLLHELAEHDILCVLLHMPGNLAVLDINAAEGITEQYPEISDWYIAGHSLGGSMAATYAAGHSDLFRGLILLASYSTSDLTESGLSVLSIYGTEDGVLNREAYEKNLSNLPSDLTECIIEGGCHAYFGDYGEQKGDGIPTITQEEQLAQTVTAVMEFIRDRK